MRQLLPGERLIAAGGETRIDRYWEYPDREDASLHDADAVGEPEAGLRWSVREQMASDVPVGLFLSGGVHSSVLACLAREAAGQALPAYCAGGDGAESIDFDFARLCAGHARLDYGEVRLGPDEYLDCWQWMVEQTASPLSTPTDVVLYCLAREMRKSVGVVLGGEGADETLCGYAVQH